MFSSLFDFLVCFCSFTPCIIFVYFLLPPPVRSSPLCFCLSVCFILSAAPEMMMKVPAFCYCLGCVFFCAGMSAEMKVMAMTILYVCWISFLSFSLCIISLLWFFFALFSLLFLSLWVNFFLLL